MEKIVKLLNYFMWMSLLPYCCCSNATPKTKIPDLTCPYVLPEKKYFPVGWKALGEISGDKLQLRSTGLIDGNASNVKDRNFTEEMIDEWNDFPSRSEALWEYDKDHEDLMLKCIYAKSYEDAFNSDINNIILLIPLPPKKAVSCLFVRRNIEPRVEASCKVK